MKRNVSMMAGSLLAVLIAAGGFQAKLSAQDPSGEIFTVPFAFTADGHSIEPGTYEIRRSMNPFLISIENLRTGDKQLFSVRPEGSKAVPEKGLLVFSRCGEQRKLSEFHIRGTNLYSTTIDPRRSRNSEIYRCSPSGITTIAAR
jgi:hypothetical protein